MAYRPRRSTSRRTGYRAARSGTYRRASARRSGRTVKSRRAAAPQTLRIVIEGIPGSSVARPTMPAKPARKAKF